MSPSRFSRLFPCRSAPSSRGGLSSSVFHALRPIDLLLSISQLDNRRGRYELDVVHLVAVRAEDGKIREVIVILIAVEMSDLKNLWYPKAAIGADRGIVFEC
jgi:hypothetical protein